MATVMLIDGNSLAYRAFFALPTDMATSSGQATNAIYGFTAMLINLLNDYEQTGICVAFDRPEATFRHRMTPTYKAQRQSAPDILRQQLGLVRELLDALAIPVVDKAGYEADDIIATLATEARDRGDDVIIVTGDRDSYQLVEDPHVKVLYNRRGVSDYVIYDEAGIKERTGVRPCDYVAYAALRGDGSDNLPGVPGVGEKTAARLVNERGGIDGIYESLDELTPKLRENLTASEAAVRNNVEMMRLVRDVPMQFALARPVQGEPDVEAVRKLFDFLEIHSLWDRLAPVLGESTSSASSYLVATKITTSQTDADAVSALAAAVAGHGVLALGVSEAGVTSGLAFVADSDAAEVHFVPSSLLLVSETVTAALRDLLGGKRSVAMHGSKATMRALLDHDVEVGDLAMDTRLAAYLLDPADRSYELDQLLTRHTGLVMPASNGAPEGMLDFDSPDPEPGEESARQALAVDRLVNPLRETMAAQGLLELLNDMELPLVRVLAKMEHRGIGVDPAVLGRIRDELTAHANTLRQRVVDSAGREFNVNSTKQLSEVLFKELGLTPSKKTKTGYSTDARSLEKMRGSHPIVNDLLEYREVEKLRSTYGEGLLAEVGDGNRIRATFNQTVARTGRLSSDQPNLHNIPIRSERGRVFRTAFVAPDGYRLLIADYDQIELRCIAHLAEDPGLIEAFEAGEDIHKATAAKVFGISADEVGVAERSTAKMVSYGLAYGMESYGLSQRLDIAVGEAEQILESYFAAFPLVRQYMKDAVELARRRGYTETLFGRRRQIPELSSRNRQIRQAGERQAMNAGIQGLAADIFKVALVHLDRALEDHELQATIVLQVHDEIIVEAPAAEVSTAADLMRKSMRDAFELRVPLEVDLRVTRTWAEAKS